MAANWPSGSQKHNLLDCELWPELEMLVCKTRHRNLDSLKRALVAAAAAIFVETVRITIADWRQRLSARIKVKGEHFEGLY